MFVNALNQKLLQLLLEKWLSLILIVVWPDADLQTLMLYVCLSVHLPCTKYVSAFHHHHNQKEAF